MRPSDDTVLSVLLTDDPPPSKRLILYKLLRQPRRSLAAATAWVVGKRLRARQSLAALIGIDRRLALPASFRLDDEPDAALAAAGIGLAGRSPDPPLVLATESGHRLAAGAAAAIATAFARDPDLHALYGDAVLETADGSRLPLLRPAFDPELLRSIDYVGPVAAFRRSSLTEVGLDADVRGVASEICLVLEARFGEGAVRHLPRVLSIASPSAPTLRAPREGVRHDASGPQPLVSLIVPTRDRLDLLEPCLASLDARTDWPCKEILVCDNGSRDPATLAYLAQLEETGRARVIRCPGPFNFAAMNNLAAGEARGRLLAFVNNDVEAFQADWLMRMVREALRPGIGAVGAKLLDGEGRIQHGGIVLGTGGLVTHGHRHFAGDAPGYLGALSFTQRVSAVTAACLVIEAETFHRVGGFDAENFAVDFNDVDLCLRLNAAGLRTLLVPSAVLHHREAASRRRTPESEARHEREVAALKRKWGPLLAQDPHYHPGFDPNLSTHARLRPGWTGREAAEPR